jgi:fluoroacetyl-CoA thioesterase
MNIESGLVNETQIIVQDADTARASGGETLPPVLSTPKLISYLERTAHASLLPSLTEGQSTVGTSISLRHLAATPLPLQIGSLGCGRKDCRGRTRAVHHRCQPFY